MSPSQECLATVRVLSSATWLQLFTPHAVLSVDVMDISGETQRDLSHNILKTRLDKKEKPIPNSFSAELRNDLDKMNEQTSGDYCGSCYGGLEPASGCCNTCEEVRTAYVNRGWSFTNPDAIEQVKLTSAVGAKRADPHNIV